MQERSQFVKEKDAHDANVHEWHNVGEKFVEAGNNKIKLNVGGHIFETSKATLMSESALTSMLSRSVAVRRSLSRKERLWSLRFHQEKAKTEWCYRRIASCLRVVFTLWGHLVCPLAHWQ